MRTSSLNLRHPFLAPPPLPLGDVGNYYYGQGHVMKPHRIRMTHSLLLNYGLYRKMEVYVCITLMPPYSLYCTVLHIIVCHLLVCSHSLTQRPSKASHTEMTRYHSDDYISFLRRIQPDNQQHHQKEIGKCRSIALILDANPVCLFTQYSDSVHLLLVQ